MSDLIGGETNLDRWYRIDLIGCLEYFPIRKMNEMLPDLEE